MGLIFHWLHKVGVKQIIMVVFYIHCHAIGLGGLVEGGEHSLLYLTEISTQWSAFSGTWTSPWSVGDSTSSTGLAML